MLCFQKKKQKKEIERLSNYIPNKHVALIVPHSRKKSGAYSVQLNASEYFYINTFYRDFLIEALVKEGLGVSIHYRNEIGIAGAYKEALTNNPFIIMEWHFNAYDGYVNGHEILFHNNTEGEKWAAKRLLDVLGDILGNKKRGVKNISKGARGFYNVTQTSKIPSLLIEPFFGDNPSDAKNFDDKKEILAKAIAKELAELAPLIGDI